jgi:transposase
MPSKRREQQLLDLLWVRVRNLLPPKPAHPRGGRPFADDKACFAGVVYQLRNACRWNDLPACFPSGVTCWRRHRDWTRAGVWSGVWKAVLAELAAAGLLDATQLPGRHLRGGAKRGACVGATRCEVGVKIEVVTDARGTPLGVATDAALVSETMLGPAALADIPAGVTLPPMVPVVADRAYDSDPLRAHLAARGLRLLSPHRRGRVRPPANDGRRMRRYRRRYVVERTFAWLHVYRRVVTRFERKADLHDGFVHLALAFICLNKLL